MHYRVHRTPENNSCSDKLCHFLLYQTFYLFYYTTLFSKDLFLIFLIIIYIGI